MHNMDEKIRNFMYISNKTKNTNESENDEDNFKYKIVVSKLTMTHHLFELFVLFVLYI